MQAQTCGCLGKFHALRLVFSKMAAFRVLHCHRGGMLIIGETFTLLEARIIASRAAVDRAKFVKTRELRTGDCRQFFSISP
jgi:hypothetical protein